MEPMGELVNILRRWYSLAIGGTPNIGLLLHGFSGSFQDLILLPGKTDLSSITTM